MINIPYGNGIWFDLLKKSRHDPWLWADNTPYSLNEYNNWFTEYQTEEMNLASINSAGLNSGLRYHIINSDKYYWIGMNRINDTENFPKMTKIVLPFLQEEHGVDLNRQSAFHSFTWMDDSPVTFEYWRKPDSNDGNCAVITFNPEQRRTGFWSKSKYIDVWELYGNKCFLFPSAKYEDYQQAAQFCRRVSGTLAEIRTFEENTFIEKYAKKYFLSFIKGLWIGLRKTNTSNYIWQSGNKPEFEYWYDLDDKKGNCVSLNTSLYGHWTSHSCDGKYFPFVCQVDVIKADSSGMTIGAKVGLGIGIAIGVFILIGTFGGVSYKRQSSRESPKKIFHNRASSFGSTTEMSKYYNEATA
ncbi:DgyrCDS14468 [Dimorphilus gyrociliatus]|uniref:DgyrCDS14468 n=1 Tax=Dimorphilus gyrociliatus TaxID=2664684 RepID=A0A7I8WDP6_9ANNE|nr:DgyrCDS14468 [Dimorphilus gyrociliatus]